MARIRIETDGRAPSEIEEYLEKAVRAISVAQDTDFRDHVMHQYYAEGFAQFTQIMDAIAEDIGALQ